MKRLTARGNLKGRTTGKKNWKESDGRAFMFFQDCAKRNDTAGIQLRETKRGTNHAKPTKRKR